MANVISPMKRSHILPKKYYFSSYSLPGYELATASDVHTWAGYLEVLRCQGMKHIHNVFNSDFFLIIERSHFKKRNLISKWFKTFVKLKIENWSYFFETFVVHTLKLQAGARLD